ncbi:2,3-bisphosphoglycerate-dependent phosphoglycerate mutase [Chlamydia abortus]|uniref:histidine phosphatase family protein n=1 Tax=Paenibacillus sp. 32O-W TaxID=1695218 RepID=UPI000A27D09C|nr:histidine phosphatase family protein [Paenibacillus sp. 32O-W]SHE12828.1 2,3-bisphosphoglycerate-dependent phosphoglycerate mutase [Chlamydia abortus]
MMDNKTKIYLVRHGQTEWNVKHKFQGHQDSPLTDMGIKQAQWLEEAIRNEQIDMIYSSSSLRARRTAEIIRGTREIDIIESDDLREINLGIWEGRTQDEVKELYLEAFNDFWDNPEKFKVENSETFRQVSDRAINMMRQTVNDNQGKSILIVTHTVVVKLIMAYFEGRPMKELWNPPYIHPACLCKVEIDGDQSKIILHGDISHYKEEPSLG